MNLVEKILNETTNRLFDIMNKSKFEKFLKTHVKQAWFPGDPKAKRLAIEFKKAIYTDDGAVVIFFRCEENDSLWGIELSVESNSLMCARWKAKDYNPRSPIIYGLRTIYSSDALLDLESLCSYIKNRAAEAFTY